MRLGAPVFVKQLTPESWVAALKIGRIPGGLLPGQR